MDLGASPRLQNQEPIKEHFTLPQRCSNQLPSSVIELLWVSDYWVYSILPFYVCECSLLLSYPCSPNVYLLCGGEGDNIARLQDSRPRQATLNLMQRLLSPLRDPEIKLDVVIQQDIWVVLFWGRVDSSICEESSTRMYFVCTWEDSGKSNNAHQCIYVILG